MAKIRNIDDLEAGKPSHRSFSGSIIKMIDKENQKIDFIISTATNDRYGDTIQVSGWDLKAYKKNPVVLFGHNSRIPPVGKATKIWKENDALMATAQFMPEEMSEFAYSIYQMYLEGYLKAVSVGFNPIDYEYIKDDEGNWTGGINFKKQELLEFSAVPIPANPEALIQARQKGINTNPIKEWAEEMLDGWDNVASYLKEVHKMDRPAVENIRRRAASSERTLHLTPEQQDELAKRNLEAIRAQKSKKAAEAKTLKTISIEGLAEFEVPALEQKDEFAEIGTLQTTIEEINGQRSIHIDLCDDVIEAAPEVLSDDFASVTHDISGEKEVTHITFKASNMDVTYEVIGALESGNLYMVQVGKELHTSKVDNEGTAGDVEPEEVAEEKKSEETAETADKVSDVEVDEEKGKKPKKPVADDDDSNTVEKPEKQFSLLDRVGVTEKALQDLEEALDQGNDLDKHGKRKAAFLASYLREMADMLDGGKTLTTTPVKEESSGAAKKSVVSEKDSQQHLTYDDVMSALKDNKGNLKSMLEELITAKLNKVTGRLD